jgi:hypothetical protein
MTSAPPAPPAPDMATDVVARSFARCFCSHEGQQILAHLRRIFLDRRLPPSARDAELWYLEGQRSVVAHMLALVERGRTGPAGPS